jgi:hypothetical protein
LMNCNSPVPESASRWLISKVQKLL